MKVSIKIFKILLTKMDNLIIIIKIIMTNFLNIIQIVIKIAYKIAKPFKNMTKINKMNNFHPIINYQVL